MEQQQGAYPIEKIEPEKYGLEALSESQRVIGFRILASSAVHSPDSPPFAQTKLLGTIKEADMQVSS